MLAYKLANEHWTAQHKARIVAAQAAQKPRRGEFELYVGHLFTAENQSCMLDVLYTQTQNLEVSI